MSFVCASKCKAVLFSEVSDRNERVGDVDDGSHVFGKETKVVARGVMWCPYGSARLFYSSSTCVPYLTAPYVVAEPRSKNSTTVRLAAALQCLC